MDGPNGVDTAGAVGIVPFVPAPGQPAQSLPAQVSGGLAFAAASPLRPQLPGDDSIITITPGSDVAGDLKVSVADLLHETSIHGPIGDAARQALLDWAEAMDERDLPKSVGGKIQATKLIEAIRKGDMATATAVPSDIEKNDEFKTFLGQAAGGAVDKYNHGAMQGLNLPAIGENMKYDQKTEDLIRKSLTSVMAGSPGASTYKFYEVIDQWLGPWGDQGYPINYGKLYNIKFNTNEKLNQNPITRDWVWNTTIDLQKALLDFIIQRYRDHTLGKITEPELRAAAFKSHAKAYVQAGLPEVALAAPELLPYVAAIPAKEFIPTSPNFASTISQVFSTAELTIESLPRYIFVGVQLDALNAAIDRGAVDGTTLRFVADELKGMKFPEGLARKAQAVINAANSPQRK